VRTSEIDYAIRRSARARRVRVHVDPLGEVWVTLPSGAPTRCAAEAVTELEPWIRRRLARAGRARETLAAREGSVPLLDEQLTLRPEQGRSRVARRGSELLVPAGDPRPALERFLRREARREIARRLDAACARAGLEYTALSIRAQRTRWASCSSRGAMSFNWRLMMAPDAVLEYVVWHEVCHLAIADHSPRFWGMVERYRPTWRAERAWLAEHGATLTL
jgi:hypothetical protein